MKKLFFILFLTLVYSNFAQILTIKGKVVDQNTREPLQNANIILSNKSIGTTTSEDGEFTLSSKLNKSDEIKISFVGYKTKILKISSFKENEIKIVGLRSKILESQSVLVKGSISDERTNPTSFSKLHKNDIEATHSVQDVPEYLSYLPSTTTYSENGNGLGYNYLTIRGFDQRRISISVNGIPQNDPEDHNVYWIDLPDLLATTELIQVQRGSGSGILGYPAIGGSINLITSPFSNGRLFKYSTTYGSYNTVKHSFEFASGLINNKYSIYAKIGKVRSSGYRLNSWVDFTPIHFSAVRYDDKLTTQLNIYGGPISDGLAYYGMPKSFIKDKDLRKSNVYRPDEKENFWQPHIELLNEYKFNDDITFNSALFTVVGKGFFDYDGSWSIYYDDYFRLKENGYDKTKTPQNALIRAQVENLQWGWIPRVSIKHTNGELIVGSEIRIHNSTHWGSINYAENLPKGVTKDYRYYYYEGGNNIFTGFVNENYTVNEKLNVLAEVQLAYHNYKIANEKYLGNNFEVDGLYLNPRIGVNYLLTDKINTYATFARVTREPRLKNYYDAAESSGGAVPQFRVKLNGKYDFTDPLVKPETMNNFELGSRYESKNLLLSGNFYYMLFDNEIVKNGQLDRFGQPITGNIDQTRHYGFELSAQAKVFKNFDILFNASYSNNTIVNGKEFVSDTESIDLTGNKIGGFPEFLFNAIFKYNYQGFLAQVNAKYVGDYYSNNYDSKGLEIGGYDNNVDAYFIANVYASYNFRIGKFFRNVKVFGQINNLFDQLYAAHAVGSDFYPSAERNFLIGLELGI